MRPPFTESEFTVDGNNILLSFMAFLAYIGTPGILFKENRALGFTQTLGQQCQGTPKNLPFKALLFHLMLVATDHILQNMLQGSVRKLLYKCLLTV